MISEAPIYNIAPAIEHLAVPLPELKLHPENTRRSDLDPIEASYRRFGQLRPIIALLDGTIVAGNHQYRVAGERLEWTHIAAVKVDLSPEDAEAFLVADNRIPDMGSYDEQGLAAQLTRLMDEGNLEGTGFSPDQVEDLVAAIESVPTTPPEAFEGGYSEEPGAVDDRYEGRREGRNEEIAFLLPFDRAARFKANLTKLKQQRESKSAADVIYDAVAEAVE